MYHAGFLASYMKYANTKVFVILNFRRVLNTVNFFRVIPRRLVYNF